MAYRLNTPIILGYTTYDPRPVMASLGFPTASTWLELGLLPHEDQTVTEVSAYVDSKVGTPGTSIVCELCDASGTVIATATSPNITAALAWYDWTGLSVAVTHRTQYWIRFRNGHGTPASNSVSITFGSAGTGGISVQSGNNVLGWTQRETGTGGAPYTLTRQSSSGWQVKFGDGSYQGLALQAVESSGSTTAVYQSRRCGARLTTPVNANLALKAISITLGEVVGIPASGMIAEVRNPTTVVATSLVYPSATLVAGDGTQRATFYFATPVSLAPNSDYRIVVGMSVSSGDVFNCYHYYSLLMRSTAASRGVLPFKGTMKQTFYNGTTWADDQDRIPLMLFFLDNDEDFPVLAAGGGGAGGLVGGGLVR